MNKTAKIVIGVISLILLVTGTYLLHKTLKREAMLSSYQMGCVNGIEAAIQPPIKTQKEYDFIVKICGDSAKQYVDYIESK